MATFEPLDLDLVRDQLRRREYLGVRGGDIHMSAARRADEEHAVPFRIQVNQDASLQDEK